LWWQSVVEGDPDEAVGQRRGPLSSAVELPEGQDDYSLRFWGIDGRPTERRERALMIRPKRNSIGAF
jgi:hypothetical protein